MPKQLHCKDYTVGWVCALPVELAAAQEMLDEEHAKPERDPNDNDENTYTLGSIGGHNVAIVCLPAGRIGNNPAAAVATQMRATFKSIRFGLMVGIGGGVPSATADIRLGDVVVSQPYGTFSGVVQYDMGKSTPSGFKWTGSLNSPPQILLGAVAHVRANAMRGQSTMSANMAKLERIATFQRSRAGVDILFDAEYEHEGGDTCDGCCPDRQKLRPPRQSGKEIAVHYGTIASGNQVMRDAVLRNKLSEELGGVLCFEMEAAGLMNSFPCLVVRGICDYSDSHKNKTWQPYAAATAATYAKEVLMLTPPVKAAETDVRDTEIREKAAPKTESKHYLYFPKNNYFVGRTAELDELKQRLLVDQNCRELSILGLGGTGKTQVALQFAYFVKETQPEWSVFWVSALSMGSFEQTCLQIAKELGISRAEDREEDVKELVKQHLSSSQAGRWLLIVDNADDPKIFFRNEELKGVADYLPTSETGLTVYTTRTPYVAEKTRADVIQIREMDRKDAMTFLTRSLTSKSLLCNDGSTEELLEELAYLPLAITQAAAYLNKNRMSVTKYLRLLRNTEQSLVTLMSKEFRDDTRYRESENAIAKTWVVSFSQIQKQHKAATDLLAFMSCIEWKAIPRSLLPRGESEMQMEDAIGTLCGYSLLTRRYEDSKGDEELIGGDEEEEWYDMHRLVHLATKIWLSQHGDSETAVEKAVKHTALVFPWAEHENREVWKAYLPHALCLLKQREELDLEEISKLCLFVGVCHSWTDRVREALPWLEESCRRRSGLDEDDPDRLLSQFELGTAYRNDRQAQKAIKLLEHVVKVRETTLEENNPDRLSSQQQLASAYADDGQLQRAIKLLEHVVGISERVLTEDDSGRLNSQHLLAVAYRDDGQTQKAIQLLEHVVKIRETLPEDHPNRLVSQHVLAVAYRDDGQTQKAIQLLEHVVKMREALPEDHPDRLVSQHELAVAYWKGGQKQKAIQLMEHIVAVQARVLPEDHPSRTNAADWLEFMYKELAIESGEESLQSST